MYLLNFLRKLIKDDGFELVDANSKSYIIGKPKKTNPIKFKILDKTLHWNNYSYLQCYICSSKKSL